MIGVAKSLIHRLGRSYIERLCRLEAEHQEFRKINERSIEYAFVFRSMTLLRPETVLDVGTGTSALPSLLRTCGPVVRAIDNIVDYWPEGMTNRHYFVENDDITKSQVKGRFDLVTCISTLEHIEAYDDAVGCMFRLLEPGGHLILTCPYREESYVPNVYKLEGAAYGQDLPYICQMFCRDDLDRWLAANNAVVREQEFWRFWTGDFWTGGEPVVPPQQVQASERHQLTCLLMQKHPQGAAAAG